jgi:hypothetical protein
MSTQCRVCESPSSQPVFSATILGQEVDYFDCEVCGYVQTENPTWLEVAYKSAINLSDTGIMRRNRTNLGMVLGTLASIKRRRGLVVDCAGGYGMLVRLLRDEGIDAFWSDPYCSNLFAVGFERTNQSADLVTAFEAFEHFVDPVQELRKLLSVGPSLLISTEIISSPAPRPEDWWYYGLDHGQHVGFFRIQTLQFLADLFGMNLVTDGKAYHLFTKRPVSRFLWRLATRAAKRSPALFSRGLESKTWSDFEKMSATR